MFLSPEQCVTVFDSLFADTCVSTYQHVEVFEPLQTKSASAALPALLSPRFSCWVVQTLSARARQLLLFSWAVRVSSFLMLHDALPAHLSLSLSHALASVIFALLALLTTLSSKGRAAVHQKRGSFFLCVYDSLGEITVLFFVLYTFYYIST